MTVGDGARASTPALAAGRAALLATGARAVGAPLPLALEGIAADVAERGLERIGLATTTLLARAATPAVLRRCAGALPAALREAMLAS